MSAPDHLLEELEPVVADNLDRHLSLAQEWHPHDYIPWSQGRDFAFLGGEDWSPEQSRLSETAKAAMITNLLTEDNLPSYHREIATRFGHRRKEGAAGGRAFFVCAAATGRHRPVAGTAAPQPAQKFRLPMALK